MPPKKKVIQKEVKEYTHEDKRKNNPPAGLAEYNGKPAKAKKYCYDPHLSPQLIWADKPGLNSIEIEEDKAGVTADTVSLHIHERISPHVLIQGLQKEEPQLDLFGDPKLPFTEAVKFYEHDMDWANRLILGDSLLVANSLIENESMAGKVQMIYIDPPYGVKYSSNFQAKIDSRDVKDGDEYLTREPEQIKAYRDTWSLGIHSYLTYLRDRLRVCKDLLTESGSVFVQISDENVHLVRCLMDEVFGRENFVNQIGFQKSSGRVSDSLDNVFDVLIWYAKNRENYKFIKLFRERTAQQIDTSYNIIENSDGSSRNLTKDERFGKVLLPEKSRRFRPSQLYSQTPSSSSLFSFKFEGNEYKPSSSSGWRTNEIGLIRLVQSNRVLPRGQYVAYKLFEDDFPYIQLHNIWTDTLFTEFGSTKAYVVQTSPKVIERCLLMTTDPGDLVFDPTCGSGTTAFVAEQWGRRWITCDTSRVALSIARQRLMTATFPYYIISDEKENSNPKLGFKYKTVPHITLKSIANNTRIDEIAEDYNPKIENALNELNKATGESFKEWEVPFELQTSKDGTTNPSKDGTTNYWSENVKRLWKTFRDLKQAKQKKIDEIIAQDAPQEKLYDQPYIDSKTVRVTGTFTVEAIPPPVVQLESPIEEMPDDLATFNPNEIGLSDDNHIPYLIRLLEKDGITFPDNKKVNFDSLHAHSGGVIHAEGISGEHKYAVSFGPLHGAVSTLQVIEGIREAYLGGFNDLIFCGFAFDPEAQATINDNPNPKIKAHASHIRPDILLTDSKGESLLKTTADSQLFSVFGEPDIEIDKKNDEYIIRLLGVDIYDPVTGKVHSDHASRIAAWFADTDYNGQIFFVRQAFFPDKSAWQKIERALKGTLDPEQFDRLTSQESFPFALGKNKKAAVKVIDQRGNEVMKVIKL